MRKILFLTGGISQGKRGFARKLWKIWFAETKGTETAACREADGKTASWEEFQQADIAWNLQEMARVRLENPDGTLKELGEALDPPVGKSGVNHRLRKLSLLAEELRSGSGSH